MSNDKDYLSEFEREFELNDYSSEYNDETNTSDEYENDFSNESNDEYELSSAYESNDEYELNDEFELDTEQQDSEMENYLQEYDSREHEFEDRLYSALSGEHENSFEMEQEIDRVLHEMEKDYFFGSIGKFLKKKVGGLGGLANIAKQFIPGGNLASLAKFAGGNLRGLLKNDFIKKGLSMAANAYLPGVGGVIAGQLLNREAPADNDVRAHAAEAVKVTKDAFQNMAKLLPNLRQGNVQGQIRRFSQQALTAAKGRHSRYRGRAKRVIRINANSVVVVKPGRVIIYS
jgi:hypothetical protein